MRPRTATAEEAAGLWPAVTAEHLMESPVALGEYYEAGPWRVRVAGRGEAALLGAWRFHLDVLAMRGVWCSERHVADFASDAIEMARERDFGRVLSPLLPADLLGGYRRAGLRDTVPIVAIQGIPDRMRACDVRPGVALRAASLDDLPALTVLDAQCFDDFWGYRTEELSGLLSRERCTLAETAEGELIGYTLATVSRGAAMLSRLCTAPQARRMGVGAALLADVGAWCRQAGASTIALCTQEENAASRALYASAGLVEIRDRYALALGEV
jgi:[ribosomal protein S18]-alanine N-acetyltransferase